MAEVDIAQAAVDMAAAAAMDPPPGLLMLRQRFGLSRFEQDLLLLCAALELDTSVAALCAQVHDQPQRPYPTFALALAVFDEPTWEALSPDRPLRYWRLIEVNQPGAQPLTSSPLRADERIVNHLKGLDYLDDRLMPLVTPLEGGQVTADLTPSERRLVDTIVRRVRHRPADQRLPIIQLLGSDSASKRLIAAAVATTLGLRPYRLPAELLPSQAPELERLARLCQRESILLPVAFFLDAQETTEALAPDGPASSLDRFLERTDGLFFLATRDVRPTLERATLAVDVAKPTQAEQQAAWAAPLGPAAPSSPAVLAAQFNLNLAAIREITATVLAEPLGAPEPAPARLWSACLARTRPRLDTLAQRLQPSASWDDIVLPEDGLNLLRQIVDQVSHRQRVYETWGFRRKMNRGLGIMALFAGESGTGKTMAAEVIANALSLNLYRIDLAGVVSKYIGETEKNLRQLFDAAEDGGAILLFDEADALFGKRGQVKDSHDRYANIEINYLLQRVEAYQGLAILTTNRTSDLDEAFSRRLRFIVNFSVPDHADRARIWRHVFPPDVPVADLDYERLAHFKLAGGSIHNIALNATFLAAAAGTPVTMALLFHAARTEHLKVGRIINATDFV